MADQWYTFGTGFLLVYSVTDRTSFEALPNLHEGLLRVKDRPYVPCVIVSNKVRSIACAGRADEAVGQCDLGRWRQVGQIEGRDMARSLSAPFVECSAVDGVNVDVAFRELVRLVRKDERVVRAPRRRCSALTFWQRSSEGISTLGGTLGPQSSSSTRSEPRLLPVTAKPRRCRCVNM